MTLDDVLGLDRFEQHHNWRCSGRVEGEIDDIEPRTFVMERHIDRWVLTDGNGSLVVMGDATRDLVAAGGGLERRPAPDGFRAYLSASLVKETGLLPRDAVAASEVVTEPRPVVHATRPAVEVEVRTNESTWRLRIDDETGIWVHLQTESWLVTLDQLDVGPPAVPTPMLALLDHLPDVDLSHRETVRDALLPVLEAVQRTSGLQAEVLSQDERTMTFQLALVDADGQTAGRVLRRRAMWSQSPSIFSGSQSWISGPDWEYHVDTSSTDPRTADRIMRAVTTVVPLD